MAPATPPTSFLSLSRELRDIIYEYYLTATHNRQPAIGNPFPSPQMSLHDALRGPAGAIMHVHPQITAEYKQEIFKHTELVGKYYAQRANQRVYVSRHVARLMGQSLHFAARIQNARFHIIHVQFPSSGAGTYARVGQEEGTRNWLRDVTELMSHLPGLRDVVWNIHEPTRMDYMIPGFFCLDHRVACLHIERFGCGSRTVQRLSVVVTPTMMVQPTLRSLGPTSHVWETFKADYARDQVAGQLRQVSVFARDEEYLYRRFFENAASNDFAGVLPDATALTYQAAHDAAMAEYDRWLRAGSPRMNVLVVAVLSPQDHEFAIGSLNSDNVQLYYRWLDRTGALLEEQETYIGMRTRIMFVYGGLRLPYGMLLDITLFWW